MTQKYMGSIVAFSVSKSVEPNEEQKEMTSGFQQGNVCKYWNYKYQSSLIARYFVTSQ